MGGGVAPKSLLPQGFSGFARRGKTAFTLAEVIITLGVIGVVAAMTLPTVIQSWQEKATISKLKKMYSTLQQAYTMNKALNEIKLGQTQSNNAAAAKEVADVFVPYLKISKDCGTDKKGCVYDGIYKRLNGNNTYNYEHGGGNSAYRVLLNDGSSIWFKRTTDPGYPAIIFYDANGSNPPNMWGKDLFNFQIVGDRILPVGASGTVLSFNPYCKLTGQGLGCAAWVLQEENFEYLKCDDLQLNGPKKKCN